MKPTTLIFLAVTSLLSVTIAQQLTLEDARQEALERIQAANVTIPLTKGIGGKNLMSYRDINPYMIADLLTAHVFIYVTILFNYPEFYLYDFGDLRLIGTQYIPQRIEFNYVKRV